MPVAATPLERADGLVLIGESKGSGYRTPPALVRRTDGQTLQLTPLLYAVVEAVDGRRSVEEVAEEVRRRTGKPVSADNVTQLVDSQLRPLGLLTQADGAQPQLKRSDPLLGLKAKVSVTDPARTRALTAPFALLFTPLAVGADRGGLPRGLLVAAAGQGTGLGRQGGLRPPGPAAPRGRGDRAVGRVPRVRPRRGSASRRRAAGSDGRRDLPGLAGVLHRRHRQLPARPSGSGPHRPGRAVLQRHRRGRDRRRLAGDLVGRPAAGGRHADPADAAPAPPAGPLRRLPRARRHHRRARPLLPDRAGAAVAVALRRHGSEGERAQARGPAPWSRRGS